MRWGDVNSVLFIAFSLTDVAATPLIAIPQLIVGIESGCTYDGTRHMLMDL
jgi:hypothetical protein